LKSIRDNWDNIKEIPSIDLLHAIHGRGVHRIRAVLARPLLIVVLFRHVSDKKESFLL
jgi:hypothetical protein